MFCLQNVHTVSGAHQWAQGSFPGGSGPGVKFKIPSCTEVKNAWRYTSIPPICLDGVDGDNFTVYFSVQINGNICDDKQIVTRNN